MRWPTGVSVEVTLTSSPLDPSSPGLDSSLSVQSVTHQRSVSGRGRLLLLWTRRRHICPQVEVELGRGGEAGGALTWRSCGVGTAGEESSPTGDERPGSVRDMSCVSTGRLSWLFKLLIRSEDKTKANKNKGKLWRTFWFDQIWFWSKLLQILSLIQRFMNHFWGERRLFLGNNFHLIFGEFMTDCATFVANL